MRSERPYVIVNPKSGGGLSEAKWARLVGRLSEGLGPFDAAFTEARGHARDLAKEAAPQRDLVVAFGGDGTISEVAGGLLEAVRAGLAKLPELGIIPRGTGGDYRRSLALPDDLSQAARHVGASRARVVNSGHVSYVRHDGQPGHGTFVNVASFGFSSTVAHRANGSSKALGGKVAFLSATLSSLVSYENSDVILRINGGEPIQRRMLLTAIGNGRFFGGGMKICPNASLDAEGLNMVTVGDLSKGEVMRYLPRIFSGSHLTIEGVSELRDVQTVEALPADPDAHIPIELDGETPGRLPATFTFVPRSLRVRF
jgi:YegS/Rv2252/BmrU family lipid kinase